MRTTIPPAARWSLLLACAACLPAQLQSRTVSVGDRTVEYALWGNGNGTVIFESGLGDSFAIWSEVFPSVADHATAFAYNRAGVGQSSPSSNARDAVTTVSELRATLTAVGLSPPYVVVGHSIGGLYAEAFTRLFPPEVRAWVSIEGRPADFLQVCAERSVTDCDPPDSATAGFSPAMLGEWNAREATAQQVRDADSIRGDLPLRVLTGTGQRNEPPDSLAVFQELLRRNASESANGLLIEAPQSGHYIQTQEPQRVIDAVLSVLP